MLSRMAVEVALKYSTSATGFWWRMGSGSGTEDWKRSANLAAVVLLMMREWRGGRGTSMLGGDRGTLKRMAL